MKTLFPILAMAATWLELTTGGMTAESRPSAPEKVVGEPKPAPSPSAVVEIKTIPMHSRADVVDLSTRTFITKRKDGIEVRNVLTAATEIHQGPVAANLEDIKIGDYVSGSRRKISETEYTVVKITRFGPKAPKTTK